MVAETWSSLKVWIPAFLLVFALDLFLVFYNGPSACESPPALESPSISLEEESQVSNYSDEICSTQSLVLVFFPSREQTDTIWAQNPSVPLIFVFGSAENSSESGTDEDPRAIGLPSDGYLSLNMTESPEFRTSFMLTLYERLSNLYPEAEYGGLKCVYHRFVTDPFPVNVSLHPPLRICEEYASDEKVVVGVNEEPPKEKGDAWPLKEYPPAVQSDYYAVDMQLIRQIANYHTFFRTPSPWPAALGWFAFTLQAEMIFVSEDWENSTSVLNLAQ